MPQARGCTSTRHTRGRRGSARRSGGRRTASSSQTRSSSTRTSGCSSPSTARCSGRRGPTSSAQAFSLVPEYLRTPEDAYALSEYGPALGRRFRSLKLWAVLRCFGAEGLRAIHREHIRLAELFAGWVEADPDWELCGAAAVLARRFPPKRRRTRRTRRYWRARTRAVRSFSRTRSSTAATCCGWQSATRARRRTTCDAHGRCYAT